MQRTPRRNKQPDWLTAAEAKVLASEFGRRGAGILEGRVRQNVADAMRASGIRPTMIYAYFHTGLLVTETTRNTYSADQLRAWAAAIRNYGSGGAG